MKEKKNREEILSYIMIITSIVFIFMTSRLPSTNSQLFDSRFVPYVISIVILLLGVLQYLKAKKEKGSAETERVDKKTLVKTIILLILYIFLYGKLGFIISSTLFVFIETILLTPPYKEKKYVLYGLIAVIFSIGIYILFMKAFNIYLPQGILKII